MASMLQGKATDGGDGVERGARPRRRHRGFTQARHERASMNRRVRFEVRILGVATADRFHFEEEIPTGSAMPRTGELAGPLRSMAAWRRVTAVEPAPAQWNVAAVVRLEDIDCSQLERDHDAEEAALRGAGWKR